MIDANAKSDIEKYAQELNGIEALEKRVARLAEIRDREGYMAEYIKEEDGFLLMEDHCPICAAAQACQRFCKSELETFQAVLGEDINIHRVEHIIAGARRCAYRIQREVDGRKE